MSLSGMGREVEHLIHENTQLLETKLVLKKSSFPFISPSVVHVCMKGATKANLSQLHLNKYIYSVYTF